MATPASPLSASKESTLVLTDAYDQKRNITISENETLNSLFDTIDKQTPYAAHALVLKFKSDNGLYKIEWFRTQDNKAQLREVMKHPTTGHKDQAISVVAQDVLDKSKLSRLGQGTFTFHYQILLP